MKCVGFLLIFVGACYGQVNVLDNNAYLSSYMADMWIEGADVLRILWRDCSKKLVDVKDVIDVKEYFPKFMRCMKRKTLRALDRSLSTDMVPVMDGVNLVRYELVDRSGKVVQNSENETSVSTWSEKELDEGEWRTLAIQRMARVLRTHVIKLDFGKDGNAPERTEFRHRRRHQMMTMMMFGVVSIGMVVVPMGFQFLAVLGGKALLLAKMALILASIQGLKKVDAFDGYDRGKIAASPVNYGFYQYPQYDQYQKRSRSDWPEPTILPGTAPPPLPRNSQWPVDINVKYDRSLTKSPEEIATYKPELPKAVKQSPEPRLYPVYEDTDASSGIFTSIDAPTPLTDITTRPGEVQADYSIDLPYNRIHFQSPTTVVPT